MAHVTLLPMPEERFQAYLEETARLFASELVEATGLSPEKAAREAEGKISALFPGRNRQMEGQYLYVAVDGDSEVGLVWLGVRHDKKAPYAFVWDLSVRPEHQGRGYGAAIMREAEAKARELGLSWIELHVFGHNLPARRLYEKLGYEVTSMHMGKPLDA